ncbi:MAG: response regulator [Sulfuricurvum sp.]|jgi:two-component system chemotaxis response regulator CheY|uniref:response regulator n=1 Tax=Sulfuricurvum sp. TaxID=2025608 RepID=UPI0025FFA862|nr:response regulator [Sulfuricurvum sp.]MCK9372233.1 response regulator [Sulfuricurvum sp.]
MTKILIVDDNTNNRLTLKLLLEACTECTIREAVNGKEAVQMCIDEAYDLVFMDIMMPVMDGIEATRQIRSFDHCVLIVAISAMGDDYNKERILFAGAKDYMTKPINSDLFIKRLENYRLLIRWRQNQRKFAALSTNLFEEEVYSRASIFYLRNEADISEAWEYLIALDTFSGEAASDAIQVYFNGALKLLERGSRSELLLEQNDENFIMTLKAASDWDEEEMNAIVNGFFSGKHRIGSDCFSLLIPKKGPSKPISSEKMGLDSDTLGILRHSHIEKISAADYIQEMSVDFMNKLDTLEMLEESMDSHVFEMQNDPKTSRWGRISEDLRQYAAVIESLFEFQHIAFSIISLANFIDELETEGMELKNRTKLLMILSSIFGDLTSWRVSIFIVSDANDIHYLDSSLLSSCLQARMIFEENAVESGDDFELF